MNDDEVDEGLIVAAISNIEKDRVAAREYVAQKRRKLQIVKKDDHDFSGKTVYVTSDRPPPDGLRHVMNPLADYIICANQADPLGLEVCSVLARQFDLHPRLRARKGERARILLPGGRGEAARPHHRCVLG